MEEIVECEAPPQLMGAVAVYIEEPKHAQRFLQCANIAFPYDASSEHLKRIRRTPRSDSSSGSNLGETSSGPVMVLEMLVLTETIWLGRSGGGAPLDSLGSDSLNSACEPFTAAVSSVFAGGGDLPALQYHLVSVPNRSPRLSPEEWSTWNAAWPFAVPRPQPPALPDDVFIRASTERMLSLLSLCVDDGPQQGSPLPHRCLPFERCGPCLVCGGMRIVAAVVDASSGKVLVTSDAGYTEMRDRSNPSAYCAYAALDALPGDTGRAAAAAPACSPLCTDHPVTYVLKKLAEYQQQQQQQQQPTEEEEMRSASEQPAGYKRGRSGNKTAAPASPTAYLANNLDVFVSHEPCAMCAMALVHSRVGRVFYGYANPVHGGLGSVFRIHLIPSLNHHFRSFQCTRAIEEFNEHWREKSKKC